MAPVDTLWRLVESATGRNRKHEPAISKSTAALISIFFTSLYVLPFYLFRKTRPSPTLNRDAPSVIQARIRAVTGTVTVSTLTTLYLLHEQGHLTLDASLHHLGLWPISALAILKPLSLTCLLFLGPLYDEVYLRGGLWPPSDLWAQLVTSLASSIGYRNYVAGPVTEELLFRSTILPIHILSPLATTPRQLIFLTPLYFGIAHIHHFYEFRLSHPDTPLIPSLLRTLFQFTYTTIFGWYAAFVYLRTGSLYAVVIIHAFCNYMGFPRLWGKVQIQSDFSGPHRNRRGRPPTTGRGKEDDMRDSPLIGSSSSSLQPSSRWDAQTIHTVIYYTLLLIGMFGFYRFLFTLTNFKDYQLVDLHAKK